MEWIIENWPWILIAIAFLAIHLFGRGCHGSHGGAKKSRRDPG